MPFPKLGTEFHGEFSSADASALTEAASRFTLYPAGSAAAIAALGAGDQVVITGIQLTSAAAVTVTLYDGLDNVAGAGEVIAQADVAANSQFNPVVGRVPHYCQAATFPKLKTSALGAVKAVIRGYIESK